MKLLDTPEWDSLSQGQKRIVGTVHGNDGPLTTALTPAAARTVAELEKRGLVNVTWGERQAVIELREAGWTQAGWTQAGPLPEPLAAADGTEIETGLYLADGRTLYKVSELYPGSVTLIVCWEHGGGTARTTVRRLSRETVNRMTVASDRQVRRYHDFLDGKPDLPRKPMGQMQEHRFEQDPEKMAGACRFCGLEGGSPVHKGNETL